MGTLFFKELSLSMRTARFFVALSILTLAFLVSGIVGSASYHSLREEYARRHATEEQRLLDRMGGLNRVAFYHQQLLLPPAGYSYIRDLSDTRIPDLIAANVVRHRDMTRVRRGNSFIPSDQPFSWHFLLAVVGGFVAILLSYDAIAGERRDGTLTLICSNSVARWKLITAKFLALTAVNTVLILLGIVLAMTILHFGLVPVISADALITIAAFLLAAVLYMAFFSALGLLVSAATRLPSLALTVLLFIWAALALIAPSASRIAAGASVQLQTPAERDRIVRQELNRIMSEGDRTRPEVDGSTVVNYERIPFSPIEQHVANYSLDIHEAERRFQNEYDLQLFRQAQFGLALARLSPVSMLDETVAALTDTGIARLRRFLASAERYRAEMGAAVRSLDARDPSSPHVYFADIFTTIWISQLPVDDASQIPRYAFTERDLAERLAAAAGPAGALVLITLVVYVLAVVIFIRVDVRHR